MRRTGRRRLPAVAAAVAVVVSLGGGCAGTDAAGERELVVFAAASLTDAFTALGRAYAAAPGAAGAEVEIVAAGSSSLREQILAGAPADVFAPADAATMDQVVAAGMASDPRPFAANRLEIAVPAGNPGGVDEIGDLDDPELLVGLCAEEVPCGSLARQALDRAGVAAAVDTNEADVRALRTRIEAGELDAGIVYRSDVLAAGEAVEGIDLPAGANVVATYPIAALTSAPNPAGAAAFVAFVRSRQGERILAGFGFERP